MLVVRRDALTFARDVLLRLYEKFLREQRCAVGVPRDVGDGGEDPLQRFCISTGVVVQHGQS